MGYINHCTSIQYRVTGNGNLRSTLIGYDTSETQALAIVQMGLVTGYEPVILANFQKYKMQLKFETTQANEKLKINHIIVYMKPVATQRPG